MTTCDIGAITKPWPTQVRAAEQVVMEFFDQGDKERTMLNIQPPVRRHEAKKHYAIKKVQTLGTSERLY